MKEYLVLIIIVPFWSLTVTEASVEVANQTKRENGREIAVSSSHSAHPPSNKLKERQKESKEKSHRNEDVFLRIRSHLKDQNVTSGEDVHFKCKVDGRPKNNIVFTWYHNNTKISSDGTHYFISSRPLGSKLLIKNLYTFDSGKYRCEASNRLRRVHTTAMLFVSFARPPVRSEEYIPELSLPQGKCESYSGTICKEYFGGSGVYVDEYEDQDMMEREIRKTIEAMANTALFSADCKRHAIPAFCHYIFRSCYIDHHGNLQRGNRLCREDCELLKRDVCGSENSETKNNIFMQNLSEAADCSFLPSVATTQCQRLSFDPPTEAVREYEVDHGDCYHRNGNSYLGTASRTESGKMCNVWPRSAINKNPDLLAEHNFCRNPQGVMDKPWCYTDDTGDERITCLIKQCDIGSNEKILIAIISGCGALFLIGLFSIYCHCRNSRIKRERTASKRAIFGLYQEKLPLCLQHQIPQINASSLRLLTEIGDGDFGKLFKGTIVDETRLPGKQTFAIKTLKENYQLSQLEQFKRELEVMAELQNTYISSLKAFVIQPSFHCMVFEYTDQVDLHEYLILNSPSSNISKHSKANSNAYRLPSFDDIDFMDMAVQISSGLDYLASKSFIHRDIAARNVLVCGNMEFKICNLGVVRESYLSNYYTTPDGDLVPLRWMAPESLQSWKFSDKTAVWSFGVLLWEMFSYGSQPYCGYSNHEVLDMIGCRQLLSCPDQCPAKIYTLMQECWSSNTKQRPTFNRIRNTLRLWMETGEVVIVKSLLVDSLRREYSIPPSPAPDYKSQHTSTCVQPWNGACSLSERSFPSAYSSVGQTSSVSCSNNQRFSTMQPDLKDHLFT